MQADAMRADWQRLHDQVIGAGGLHIIGTERHESRRIDNQLRGRSGRQGDPGSSRFYLSMDDTLLKIFAGDRLKSIMDALKLPEGEAIEAGMVTKSIESAQRKVEARNFDIRKQLLEYDDVANDQRKVVYQQRNELLENSDTTELMTGLRHGVFTELFREHVPAESVEEQWNVAALVRVLKDDWELDVPLAQMVEGDATDEDLLAAVLKAVDERYAAKVELVGKPGFAGFERSIMLQSIDQRWREHLSALDHLRQGIHLRGYAQKNPKQEYKREAFELFESMLQSIRAEVVRVLMNVRIQSAEEAEQAERQVEQQAESSFSQASYTHSEFAAAPDADPEAVALAVQEAPAAPQADKEQPFRRFGTKVGRNDPCPCGSGRKYKQCHGRIG
jgi:preprotein translocase subunit SecA